jgi:hypothetical protein
MRLFTGAGALCALVSGVVCCAILQAASILPILHLDSATLKIFTDYIAEFEKSDLAAFNVSGKLWIDGECCGKHSAFEGGSTVVEPRQNKDVANGSIHHFTGVIHVPGTAIEDIRRVMRDYGKYPKYFAPDVTLGSGEAMPDSVPADEHFHSKLTLAQSTLWINVTYQTVYDTHYVRLDPNRWVSHSTTLSVKELLDAANPGRGTYPEGDDHGFLWKTSTYWFVRQRNGGLDLELNSISLSRPIPTGFGWWGTKRTREAVDKMLHDVKAAISSNHEAK